MLNRVAESSGKSCADQLNRRQQSDKTDRRRQTLLQDAMQINVTALCE